MKKTIRHKMKIIEFDALEDLAKRYGIVLKADFADKTKSLKAKEKMDAIREKYGRGQRKLNSVALIRKWRDSR